MLRSYVIALASLLVAAEPGHAGDPARTVLRVALYPYVPDPVALFAELEAGFESAYPDVDLQMVRTEASAPNGVVDDWSSNLYKKTRTADLLSAPEGVRPDVIEVDSVLLKSLVYPKSGQSLLEPITALNDAKFVPGAQEALVLDGKTYAVPHWVCGNFVFYTEATPAVASARSFNELALAVGDGALLLDLKGTSTLGEWYLTGLAARSATAPDRLAEPTDETVVRDLNQLQAACPGDTCRNEALHDAGVAWWARQFFLGRASAYIGYSESLHQGLEAAAAGCAGGRGRCVKHDQVRVAALPVNKDGRRVGWVDGLAIRRGVAGRTKAAAEAFIKWAISRPAYDVILTPEWPEPPRYLLPAVAGWSPSWGPLYPALESAFGARMFVNHGNDRLREHGEKLDGLLDK